MTTYSVGFLVFFSGLIGLSLSFLRENILIFLIFSEIMFLGIIITLLSITNLTSNVTGQLLALVVLTLAAIETAMGLCILVKAKTFTNQLTFTQFHTLNG